jgi:hypothetical protein
VAPLDNLPGDQRAVLQLVLQRGRSYDQIAELLSIDRAAVRQRALAAFDALGPQTSVPPEQRALITDYLLGQLPQRVSEATADRLADSPAERAWARVVASELAPVATHPLPEIPVERGRAQPVATAAETGSTQAQEQAALGRPAPASQQEPTGRRSSRRGGAILLGVVTLVIVAVVVIVLVTSGSGANRSSRTSSTAASAPPTTSTAASSATSTAATSTPQIVGQINLTAPLSSSKAKGAAFVVKRGNQTAIIVQGQSIPANSKHDAYAVWLFNSNTDNHLLGFVNPGVGTSGKLSTAGALPANAGHYKTLLVTLETQQAPKQPGKIVLQGALTGVS